MIDVLELPTIREPQAAYDALEARLKKFFRDHLYIPLLKKLDLPRKTLMNAKEDDLAEALRKGDIVYSGGKFSGKMSAGISRQLKALGAQFDPKTGSFKLAESELAPELKPVIAISEMIFRARMEKLSSELNQIDPETLAAQFKCDDLLDQSLFQADRAFVRDLKSVTITSQLTPEQRAKVAESWQNNLQLYIKDWTKEQIQDMRAKVLEIVSSGGRPDSLIPPILKVTQTIQKSHSEALNKAKFLAHQESRLMMSAFKEARYQDVGVREYIWRCVHKPHDSSPNHHKPGNVRYSHGILDGKTFRFDSPPVTTNPGQPTKRNNPGQDYNCRCFARPILRRP